MKSEQNKKLWWELYEFQERLGFYEHKGKLIGHIKDTEKGMQKVNLRMYFGKGIIIEKCKEQIIPKLNYTLKLNKEIVGQFLEKKVAEKFHREIHPNLKRQIIENKKIK